MTDQEKSGQGSEIISPEQLEALYQETEVVQFLRTIFPAFANKRVVAFCIIALGPNEGEEAKCTAAVSRGSIERLKSHLDLERASIGARLWTQ